MTLFIDIGNTRIKYTQNTEPFNIQFTLHNDLQPIFDAIKKYSPNYLVIIHGRSKTAINSLEQITTFSDKRAITLIKPVVDRQLLSVNYQDTQQLGTDRFLNLLAGKEKYGDNFCVVSCGTAITLDFYTDQHIGGMILPGLMTSQQLLADKTGLNTIEKPKQLLGNDTATCIGAGIYYGWQNLIYHSIQRIEQQQQKTFSILLTGGDAELLYQSGTIIHSLTFDGMHLYCRKTTPF